MCGLGHRRFSDHLVGTNKDRGERGERQDGGYATAKGPCDARTDGHNRSQHDQDQQGEQTAAGIGQQAGQADHGYSHQPDERGSAIARLRCLNVPGG